jgi:hypothetical protein
MSQCHHTYRSVITAIKFIVLMSQGLCIHQIVGTYVNCHMHHHFVTCITILSHASPFCHMHHHFVTCKTFLSNTSHYCHYHLVVTLTLLSLSPCHYHLVVTIPLSYASHDIFVTHVTLSLCASYSIKNTSQHLSQIWLSNWDNDKQEILKNTFSPSHWQQTFGKGEPEN